MNSNKFHHKLIFYQTFMYSYTLYTFYFDGSTQLVCICGKEANGRKQFFIIIKHYHLQDQCVGDTHAIAKSVYQGDDNEQRFLFFLLWLPLLLNASARRTQNMCTTTNKKVSMPFLCLIYITHFHMLIFTCCSLHENKHVISHCSYNRGVFLSSFNPKISLKINFILVYIYIL